jgi:cysteine desulfurase
MVTAHPRAYLDWNATAPLRPEARGAMLAAAEVTGNPSSLHREGRAARARVEAAREQVAALVGAAPRNVIFTSGGTEANVLALHPALESGGDKRRMGLLLVSAVEHASVLAGGRFRPDQVRQLAVDGAGRLDLDALKAAVAAASAAGQRVLVSLMHANNETGVIQPVAEAATIVHAAGGLLHVDAVQTVGRLRVDIASLGADLLTVSAHKLGGPAGAGALIRRTEDVHLAAPLLAGGGQERRARAGTENVIGISGFGAAAEAAHSQLERWAAVAVVRDAMEAELVRVGPGVVVFGKNVARLPNTTLFAAPSIRAETALIALDLDGVAVSSGSACSSGKVAPSHVLAAMGVAADLAMCAVRVSLGPATTDDDVGLFLKAWRKHAEALSKGRSGLAA